MGECSTDVVKLEHEIPEEFGECVCQTGSELIEMYLFIRDVIVLCQFVILIVTSLLTLLEVQRLKTYFDFWTQCLLFISSEIGIYAIVRRCYEKFNDFEAYWEHMPCYCKIYWALFSAALPSTVLCCIVYWTKVHERNAALFGLFLSIGVVSTLLLFPENSHVTHVLMNSASTVLALLEFILISFPLRLIHFFYFVLFYSIYVLYTFIHQKQGGLRREDMYYDWDNAEETGKNFILGLVIGLVVYLFLCFISMTKLAWRNRIL